MKKVLSVLLSICMLLSITAGLNLTAFAEVYSGECGSKVSWSLDTSTGEFIVKGTGDMKNYYYGYAPWDSLRVKIKTIIIEDGVTSIGNSTFYSCENLTSVSIPNSVTSFGTTAFSNCTSLTNVAISDKVTFLGSNVFKNCTSLISIDVDSNNEKFCSQDGVMFTKDKKILIQYPNGNKRTSYSIPNGVQQILSYSFANSQYLKNITIPSGVTDIGDRTFENCYELESVTIPDSVSYIDRFAFEYCTSLKNVTIPGSVSEICMGTFSGCTSLESVVINEGVKKINSYAFEDCKNLSSVIIPNSVTTIGGFSFRNCYSLISVTVPSSVTSIDSSAFLYVNNVNYDGTVTDAPWGAKALNGYIDGDLTYKDSTKTELLGCSVKATKVTIPNSVTNIGDIAFLHCESLKELVIPCGEYIGAERMFLGCNNIEKITITKGVRTELICSNVEYTPWYESRDTIKEIVIEDGITDIGTSVFKELRKLTSVSIPNSVTTIKNKAFYDCVSLTSINISESVTYIGNGAFYDCESLTSINIPESVTYIGKEAFSCCVGLTDITIPSGVTSISDSTFYCCHSLTNISIPDGVTSIGNEAFYKCNSLTSIVIPKSVTFMGYNAFYDCSSLVNINIPEGITNLYERTFYNCKSLTNITIPNSVESIDFGVFSYCTSLKNLTMPCSTKISYTSFGQCTNIEKVTLTKGTGEMQNYGMDTSNSAPTIYYGYTPWYESRNTIKEIVIEEGVTNIGEQAFYYCTGLSDVTIPKSVTNIGKSAFGFCSCLKDVYYDGTEEQWKTINIADTNNSLFKATIHYVGAPIVEPTEPEPLPSQPIVKPTEPEHQPSQPTEPTPPAPIESNNQNQQPAVVPNNQGTSGAVNNQTVVKKPAVPVVKTVTLNGERIKANSKGEFVSKKMKKPTVSKTKAGKKQTTATWKAVKSVTGYEVQSSTDKKFKKSIKKTVVKGAKKTSVTIKKLNSKKTYYVRVRAYKTVGGKKVYSGWSNIKSVKIK